MKWTPLHNALGARGPGDLSFAMVLEAVASEVAESQTLDFKKALPLPPGLDREAKASKQSELAKDISAMANAGGGMLLYGVDEIRGVDLSTAAAICSVGERKDAVEKDIRTVASSLIQPPVRHLEIRWLVEEELAFAPPPGGDGTAGDNGPFVPRTVLAVVVPDGQVHGRGG